MSLTSFLASRESKIVQDWFELAIADYPSETALFLKGEKDPFANPVGYSMQNTLKELFRELLQGRASDNVNNLLIELLKIRAVQDFPPSRATSFILYLRQVIHKHVDSELSAGIYEGELNELENRIELLLFLAFDLYVDCREKLYQIRIDELKNSIPRVFRDQLNNTVCPGAVEGNNFNVKGSEG